MAQTEWRMEDGDVERKLIVSMRRTRAIYGRWKKGVPAMGEDKDKKKHVGNIFF